MTRGMIATLIGIPSSTVVAWFITGDTPVLISGLIFSVSTILTAAFIDWLISPQKILAIKNWNELRIKRRKEENEKFEKFYKRYQRLFPPDPNKPY